MIHSQEKTTTTRHVVKINRDSLLLYVGALVKQDLTSVNVSIELPTWFGNDEDACIELSWTVEEP